MAPRLPLPQTHCPHMRSTFFLSFRLLLAPSIHSSMSPHRINPTTLFPGTAGILLVLPWPRDGPEPSSGCPITLSDKPYHTDMAGSAGTKKEIFIIAFFAVGPSGPWPSPSPYSPGQDRTTSVWPYLRQVYSPQTWSNQIKKNHRTSQLLGLTANRHCFPQAGVAL